MDKIELKDMCRILRLKSGATQRALALLIGSTQTEISFIERGFIPEDYNKILKIETLYKIIEKGGKR